MEGINSYVGGWVGGTKYQGYRGYRGASACGATSVTFVGNSVTLNFS